MQRVCGQLKERTFFTKMYFNGTIDECQSDMESESEDTGIDDPKTPERDGDERGSMSNCSSDVASCTEQRNDSENEDSDHDDDDIELRNTKRHTSDNDNPRIIQEQSSTRRRRTRQTASRYKRKTKDSWK